MKLKIQKTNEKIVISNEQDEKLDDFLQLAILKEIELSDYELSSEISLLESESIFINLKKPVNNILAVNSYQNNINSYKKLRSSTGSRIYCLFNDIGSQYNLKSFQEEGVDFLLSKEKDFKILADDMGLGKTVQAISALAKGFQKGEFKRALIVVPNHLVFNWIKEFSLWAPNVNVGPSIPSKSINEDAWMICINSLQVIVTSYEKIKSLPKYIKEFEFDVVVADEAQKVKNSGADTTDSFASLKSKKTWLLTGTPVENSKNDMITLLKLSGKTGANDSFRDKDEGFIRSFTRQFLLRRVKTDVLDDMPKVTIVEKSIELTNDQRATYEKIIKDYKKASYDFNPLQVFNLLRRTCDYDEKTMSSAKAQEIVSIIEDIIEKKEKVVVFSYTLEPLRLINNLLSKLNKNITTGLLTGEIDLESREEIKSEFQYEGNIDVLLATAQVAGTGATFTIANHVIFFNEWWNPALNEQARDRIVRIGQEKECFVYKFYSIDTVENRLRELLKEKKELFEEIVEKLNETKFIVKILND